MKQEIITYLSTCEDELYDIAKYIYMNPEESYREYNCCKYIINFLKRHNFEVKENFLDIDTAFYASFGSGYPKICYMCEYDAVPGEGHITGHNLLTSMSLGGAIGLSKVIDKLGGSVIVLGCPGEYLGGAKITMFKQGIFNDIDVVLMAHPDVVTRESGTSSAILPLSIKFFNEEQTLSFKNNKVYTPLDATLLSFNMMNCLQKGLPDNAVLNSVLSKGGYTPLLVPEECESKIYIRADNICIAEDISSKIKLAVKTVSSLMDINHSVNFYELPYEELITNKTLSRLFSHNLKEHGIIDIGESRNINAGLSLGTISKKVPCIHPYICIIDDKSTAYASRDFANATISSYAKNIALKVSETLACTAVDLIEKSTLISEAKKELFK